MINQETEVESSTYRSDGLVFLRPFRCGGQTGASGSSLPLPLFLLASRWTYVTGLRREVGLLERSIRDTDLLGLLNPRLLHWVVSKNSIIYVTIFDPNILQGFGNFCWRSRCRIVLIRGVQQGPRARTVSALPSSSRNAPNPLKSSCRSEV